MNELFFPVVGALLVFFVGLPILTLTSYATLRLLPTMGDRLAAHESPWRFMLVVAPTLGPVIWLVSASIHQSEEGAPLAACIIDHLGGDLCRDVVLFGVILFAIVVFGVLRRAYRDRVAVKLPILTTTQRNAANTRVRAVCERNVALSAYCRRVRVVNRGLAPACTRGLVRPTVHIEASLVLRLDDDELEATLLHEFEHVHGRDPLRFFVGQVALSLNPLGALLSSELARHHFAREVSCDRMAVRRGADPLALARTIVSVASPAPLPSPVAALGGHGIGGIRVRVQLLLGYAARTPAPARRRTSVGLLSCLVAVLILWPHLMGAGPLDLFHYGIERAGVLLGLG